MTTEVHRTHFTRSYCRVPAVGLCVDVSRMNYADTLFADTAGLMQRAFDEMDALESGAIANFDEQRMVGHYWLRAPQRAPDDQIRRVITDTVEDIKRFAAKVHVGRIAAPENRRFGRVLSIGIGGSALGPQFVADALGGPGDPLSIDFIDNADPDGIDRVFARIGDELPTTLVLVISKSGGTPETRNGMLECKRRFEAAGLDFARHAVAITGDDGALREIAEAEQWLKTFPMWDWVGGRTSELSAVGLVPAALQGFDIDAMLAGAGACDEATRVHDVFENPAALLALMWHHAGEGRGAKDMVVLPYRDRLALFSRYLQQLVMESLGKKIDRLGKVVHQGIAVYGNKGNAARQVWRTRLLAFAFWSINIGLTLMVLISVLPVGLMQTWASVEHGMWYARSAEFLQTDFVGTLRWLRVVGDTIFATGIVALAWFVLGLVTGWSIAKHAEPVDEGSVV